MPNGQQNLADVFGRRLSEAGAGLFPLQQLVLNQQRQSAQDELSRAIQLQEFRNQAEQLRQGRERIGLERKRITQAGLPSEFAPPTTFSGLAAREVAAGRAIDDPRIQQFIDIERSLRRAPIQPTAAPEETAAVETVEDITRATAREQEARRAFSRLGETIPVLDTSGQPIPALAPGTQRQVLDEFGRPAFQEEPAPFPGPFTDTAQIIRQNLFGQAPGFERERFLETVGQISPQLGGFIEREDIGVDFQPAVQPTQPPVNLFGFEAPEVARPDFLTESKAQTLNKLQIPVESVDADLQEAIRAFDTLTDEQKRMVAQSLLNLRPNFDRLPAEEQTEFIDLLVKELSE